MIVLAVTSYNGAPTEPVEATFDETGGTIGRGVDRNLMVLPDPERTISRVHARVLFRNGRYAIEDRGSNPITVNGNIVGHGKEWPLNPGDVIQIGGYELSVRASGAPTQSEDFFGDVFGAQPGATIVATATPRTAPPPRPAVAAPPPPAPRRAPAPAPSAAPPGGIPDDWDPLAENSTGVFEPGKPALPAGRADAGLLGSLPPEESIDDLFGLADSPKAKAKVWDEQEDLLGIFDPSGPASGGVGESFSKPKIEDASVDHQRAELGVAFPNAVMPPAAPPPAAPPPAAVAPVPAPAPVMIPPPVTVPPRAEAAARPAAKVGAEPLRGAVVSWGDGARQTIIGVRPAGLRKTFSPQPLPSAGASAAVAEAAPPVGAAGSDELLKALLEGLGEDRAPPLTALTPGMMRLIGALLAESVHGAVELLQARASVKREVRAEVTAIRPRENNPLKFSPTAALALQHLLGPPAPGFMRGQDAMRDAFRDLRAHELAVMAGMRAALTGLLQRFDPKNLETKIAARSGLSMLLSGGRKAQLWEAFQTLYAQLSAEAVDDFNEVFGKAFLQAYEDQLDLLANQDAQGKS